MKMKARELSFLITNTNKHDYDIIKPRKRKWTIDALIAEASKYESRRAFREGSKSAYSQAQKYGILDKVCIHCTANSSGITKDN